MYTLDDRSSPLITDKFSINSTLPATCEPKLLDMYIVDSKSRNKKKKTASSRKWKRWQFHVPTSSFSQIHMLHKSTSQLSVNPSFWNNLLVHFFRSNLLVHFLFGKANDRPKRLYSAYIPLQRQKKRAWEQPGRWILWMKVFAFFDQ